MSRIGKLPLAVPDKVTVTVGPGHVKVEGPKGQLERTLPAEITVKQTDGQLVFERPSDDYKHRALHGLVRSLVANMVTGVNTGFTKHLELVGVGYRVAKQGDEVVLSLGYSHPIRFKPPEGISIDVQDPTKFSVSGISIEDVGQVAANLRGMRPPEPYKGKGVMYRGEKVRRKAGKAGKGAKARHRRVRVRLTGTAERPRLAVFRSLNHLYAQVIDDAAGRTLASVSTVGQKGDVKSMEKATNVGKAIAQKAKAAGVSRVVFDRGGFLYHGRIKALADAAREAGLEF